MPGTARLTADDIASRDAAGLLGELDDASSMTVGAATVRISDHAREVLSAVLEQLAAGHEVEVRPLNDWLTTQEAADLLRVSRPTLVKMCTDGVLPYEQPGVHRRVPRAAVEEFLAGRGHRGRALDRLGEDSAAYGADEIVSTR